MGIRQVGEAAKTDEKLFWAITVLTAILICVERYILTIMKLTHAIQLKIDMTVEPLTSKYLH